MLVAGIARTPHPIPVSAHWPFPMTVSPMGGIRQRPPMHGPTRILTTGVNQFYQYR
ncbi:MAG: hypothetical protein JO250_02215 [Armatimonadetes bacterium]|nr:hypothetical protein [Armatimonadota bacterium]